MRAPTCSLATSSRDLPPGTSSAAMLAELSIRTGRRSACVWPARQKGWSAARQSSISSTICSSRSRLRLKRWKGEFTRRSSMTLLQSTSEGTCTRGRLSLRK